ncbi:hypothetical protein FJR38_07110 [Anabaena sp. UHCC 0253]|uniref:hypothetical protein n=1 Tax=Anabaena sp. UHCC 0253 TaxID=2590019 RepID=UPI0014486C47|nr:hypothetical protein [Anabaena sp. UHCC 0253]MTJ52450.1 hypothetical protein [Anabaena sp. UHCC 0253]
MTKIELELDQETYDKIQQLTQTHHCQLSDLIKALVEQLTQPEILNDSFIGKWSNDAELVDKMIEEMLHSRA